MREIALDYLSQDPVFHMDMIEVIRRGSADILCADASGVLLYERPSGAHMISTATPEAARRMLEPVPAARLVTAHQADYLDDIMTRYGLSLDMACHQCVWTQDAPPPIPPSPFDFRPLAEADIPRAAAMYEHAMGTEYMTGRVRAGDMLGAYDADRLVGFAGLHEEGSMGLLEVDPAYRRRGIATALAARLAAAQMARGRVPFSQFIIGNEASRALNARMGFAITPQEIYWLSAGLL